MLNFPTTTSSKPFPESENNTQGLNLEMTSSAVEKGKEEYEKYIEKKQGFSGSRSGAKSGNTTTTRLFFACVGVSALFSLIQLYLKSKGPAS